MAMHLQPSAGSLGFFEKAWSFMSRDNEIPPFKDFDKEWSRENEIPSLRDDWMNADEHIKCLFRVDLPLSALQDNL